MGLRKTILICIKVLRVAWPACKWPLNTCGAPGCVPSSPREMQAVGTQASPGLGHKRERRECPGMLTNPCFCGTRAKQDGKLALPFWEGWVASSCPLIDSHPVYKDSLYLIMIVVFGQLGRLEKETRDSVGLDHMPVRVTRMPESSHGPLC